ncbi:hypothetical protein, partial [Streptomyces sp. NPDC048663]|uniref:hypothetical protein n=1 Tax=Streptomyces sp. NPDC048663 TaxID=3155638 RepID=UPI00341924FF
MSGGTACRREPDRCPPGTGASWLVAQFPASTYGWGVTYWRALMDRLHTYDPESARAVEEG